MYFALIIGLLFGAKGEVMCARMRKLNMERALCKSSLGGVLFGFGLEWSCGPQLESVNDMVVWE
eukprot:10234623-Ditylum_brightwellii.AAC.1